VAFEEIVVPVPAKSARDAKVWVVFVNPGEYIKKNHLIALLESDTGGVAEVISPYSGYIKGVQVSPGTRVSPGIPILTLSPPGGPKRGSQSSRAEPHVTVQTSGPPPSQDFELERFKQHIETTLGGALTPTAAVAAEDFWEHRDILSQRIREHSIDIQPRLDAHTNTGRFRWYAKHQHYELLSRAILLCAPMFLFFVWEITPIAVLAGLALHAYGRRERMKQAQRLARNLVVEVKTKSDGVGMAQLCAHYTKGTVALVSEQGYARWPNYPSCVLTGKTVSIPTLQLAT
jgi:hypothetical protein